MTVGFRDRWGGEGVSLGNKKSERARNGEGFYFYFFREAAESLDKEKNEMRARRRE